MWNNEKKHINQLININYTLSLTYAIFLVCLFKAELYMMIPALTDEYTRSGTSGCSVTHNSSFTYLALQIRPDLKNLWKLNFSTLLIKIKKDLDRWQKLLLSFMGRVSPVLYGSGYMIILIRIILYLILI